jgi:Flp pilus assembly protein TadG
MNRVKSFRSAARRFKEDASAAITVELVLVLPMLLWAFFATMIFNDVFRARTQAQAAALHVADAISRNTTILTTEYLEGMNDVYDFLTGGEEMSRLRITSVVWDRDADEPMVLWSYGTRGMNPLPDNAFQLMASGDYAMLQELMDGTEGENMISGYTQTPVANLHERIPPVMPGEALILVESFTMWEAPTRGIFLGFDMLENSRLSPIAVVRPRFSPFINFEGAIDAAPPDFSEFDGTPSDPISDPDPDPTAPVDPVDPVDPGATLDVVSVTDFSSGVNTGWSSTQTTAATGNTSFGNSYLGPFGNETRANPVTFTNTFSQTMSQADYEFELLVLNSWDGFNPDWAFPVGEALSITVNGEVVSRDVFATNPWGVYERSRQSWSHTAHGRVRVTMDLIDKAADIDGDGWVDQVWRVQVRIVDPARTIEIGFIADTNEPVNNESFGFSGMSLTATTGAHDPNRWVPNNASLIGTDSLTGFPVHSGCFVRNNPAPTLALGNYDLWGGPIRMRRTFGGNTRLYDCRNDGPGYFNASPLMVLEYENDTGNWDNNRFRIRTDDGTGGTACDAVLLMRDPNGQWFYVDDLAGFGWNAGLELAHAQSGTYVIWGGRFSQGTCESDIIFEHY